MFCTARAKGLDERVVINNMLVKCSHPCGYSKWSDYYRTLAGAVIVETIFNRTGIGSFMSLAAQQLDYASIMGGTLFFVYTGFRKPDSGYFLCLY